jgi:hypothetical protein
MHQFLFNSQHPLLQDEMLYGPPCTKRVVEAIEALSPMPTTRLLWGNALPEHSCYKLARFKAGGKAEISSKSGVETRTDEYHYEPDNDLFKVIICDLAETMATPPSTAREEIILNNLANGSLWTVGASHLANEQALLVDAALKNFPPYIGMSVIDLGNPAQLEVMFESMFNKEIVLSPDGILYHAESYLDQADQDEALALVKMKGSSKPIVGLDWDQFEAALPPVTIPKELSDRGLITAQRISGKAALTHRERLARALVEVLENRRSDEPVTFQTAKEEGIPDFELDPKKFTEYLLNVSHPKGGPKAKFFLEVLGIEQNDWQFLADQIKRGVIEAPLYRLDKTKWEFSHGALISVTGRNGVTAILETGWAFTSGGPARFITAYPYDGKPTTTLETHEPFIVSQSLTGDAKWLAIYERALQEGKKAAAATQPNPMVLVGYGTEWDGMCGFGWVHFPSARHPMAKWLLKNGYGSRSHPGVRVWSKAKTQSWDRNRAWADSFAAVVTANGVECFSENRVD